MGYIQLKLPKRIKHKIENSIFDDQLLINLKKKGNRNINRYSWKKCSNETEKIYKEILT